MSTTILSTPVGRDSFDESVVQAPAGAVSWGAIFAGAAGAAALSLILLILGVGLGLSSVSPWSSKGISATTFGVSTVAWLTFTQLAASGMGGYLAGRLRSRWMRTHSDEVYFRDTAHGFLAWAVASLATAVMLGSAIGSIVSGGAQAGAAVVSGAASTAAMAVPAAAAATDGGDRVPGQGYFIDALFRKDNSAPTTMTAATPDATATAPAATATAPDTAASSPAAAAPTSPITAAPSQAPAHASAPMDAAATAQSGAEAARIFANGIVTGTLPPEDAKYLGQMVAERTGMSQADAEKRVTDTFARMQTKAKEAETAARDAADKARKASATAALWIFVSLLIGAFVSSLMATFGGRQRDLV